MFIIKVLTFKMMTIIIKSCKQFKALTHDRKHIF
jgi:hypothetical protein